MMTGWNRQLYEKFGTNHSLKKIIYAIIACSFLAIAFQFYLVNSVVQHQTVFRSSHQKDVIRITTNKKTLRKKITNHAMTDASVGSKMRFYHNNNSNLSISTPVIPKKLTNEDKSSGINKCKIWNRPFNENETFQSSIKLDPNKFLYPGLVAGPNNQIVGLWQSIYMAIALNRTLVAPTFRSHKTMGKQDIPTEQRIDVERLRRFLPVVSLESFRKTCRGSFDVVLQASKESYRRIQAFEKSTKMKILNPQRKIFIKEQGSTSLRLNDTTEPPTNISFLPSEADNLTYNQLVNGDRSIFAKVYGSSARCALYSSSFHAFQVKMPNGVARTLESSYSLNSTNGQLYSAVVDAVRRPAAIVQAAKRYTERIFNGESYVAVHWRYDVIDWVEIHCVQNKVPKYLKMCDEIVNITPKDLANAVVTSLDEADVIRSAWRHVYIAAPPGLRDFAYKVLKEISIIRNMVVKQPKQDLETFLNQNYRECWTTAGWHKEKEIYSLAEMEILKNSHWLFYSLASTFSNNIRSLRWETGKDGEARRKFETSVYDAAVTAMRNRLSAASLTNNL